MLGWKIKIKIKISTYSADLLAPNQCGSSFDSKNTTYPILNVLKS